MANCFLCGQFLDIFVDNSILFWTAIRQREHCTFEPKFSIIWQKEQLWHSKWSAQLIFSNYLVDCLFWCLSLDTLMYGANFLLFSNSAKKNSCLVRNSPYYVWKMPLLLLPVSVAQLILPKCLVYCLLWCSSLDILIHDCIFFWLAIQQREHSMVGQEIYIWKITQTFSSVTAAQLIMPNYMVGCLLWCQSLIWISFSWHFSKANILGLVRNLHTISEMPLLLFPVTAAPLIIPKYLDKCLLW